MPPAHQQQHHGLLNAQAVKTEMDISQTHHQSAITRNNEVGVVVDEDMHGYSGSPATTTTQAVTTIPSTTPQQSNAGGTPSTAGQNLDDSQSGGSVMENWSDQPTMKVKV